MSHMQPEIIHCEFQIIRDTNEGDICTPKVDAEFFNPEHAAKVYDVPIENVELVKGWGARLSAPGYLDSTGWAVFDTKKQAAQYLLEMYGSEHPDFPEDWEAELEEIANS